MRFNGKNEGGKEVALLQYFFFLGVVWINASNQLLKVFDSVYLATFNHVLDLVCTQFYQN